MIADLIFVEIYLFESFSVLSFLPRRFCLFQWLPLNMCRPNFISVWAFPLSSRLVHPTVFFKEFFFLEILNTYQVRIRNHQYLQTSFENWVSAMLFVYPCSCYLCLLACHFKQVSDPSRHLICKYVRIQQTSNYFHLVFSKVCLAQLLWNQDLLP